MASEPRVEPGVGSHALSAPYLLFLGDTTEPAYAKTAFSLRDWARDLCIAECGSPGGTVSLGLPRLSPAEAYAAGARSLVIGVANEGGVISRSWIPLLAEALGAGLDVVSGMHARLADIPELTLAARRNGRRLIDIHRPPPVIPIATGRKRTGKRLLTVGTDCALGKKYAALAIARAFSERGVDVSFRATGQTGILIAGGGMPMDAVVADFEAGAAEILSPDAAPGHWDVIEGQGSLFHPSYAGVSLGLLHGSQPDVFVVCHDPTRSHVIGLPGYALPTIAEVIDLTTRLGARTNPAIRCSGVALNTSALEPSEAARVIAATSDRLNLPVADPVRGRRCLRRASFRMPGLTATAADGAQSSWFQRFLLPGFAFKAVIIGGGYATGRELAEYFLPSGPWGGLAGMLLATMPTRAPPLWRVPT